jgi:putative membrane protein
MGMHQVAIPFLPIATVGTAVAFYVGFKNNSSYDRLWEARKIWGELVNNSRSACAYLLSIVRSKPECAEGALKAKIFVYRQIAYVNVLRLQLRLRNMWEEPHLYTQMATQCFPTKSVEEELNALLDQFCNRFEPGCTGKPSNVAKELMHSQMRLLSTLKKEEIIDGFEHSDLMRICAEMFNQQGKAERIKSFPFPRQYAYFSEIFVSIFMCLLPFGLIGEFAKLGANYTLLTIPFSVLISWVFDTMEKVGDTSENPFENGINDVPMTAICRNIEIDLREMLEEEDIPQPLESRRNILM